jgi:hypothetical protein
MPTLENGLSTSTRGLIIGLVQSSVVMTMAAAVVSLGALASVGLLAVSILGLMDLSHRMNYWGVAYTGGWLIGLVLVGPSVLSGWELQATEVLVVFFLALKASRKVNIPF